MTALPDCVRILHHISDSLGKICAQAGIGIHYNDIHVDGF